MEILEEAEFEEKGARVLGVTYFLESPNFLFVRTTKRYAALSQEIATSSGSRSAGHQKEFFCRRSMLLGCSGRNSLLELELYIGDDFNERNAKFPGDFPPFRFYVTHFSCCDHFRFLERRLVCPSQESSFSH